MNTNEINPIKFSPLADRMRPQVLDDFIGQTHLINNNSFLCRVIKTNSIGSCIFYGPPGCGKTTLANIIANTCNGIFKKLNAVSSGVAEAKEIIAEAKINMELYGKKTFLLLDECHRWRKDQSDCVLEAIEKGYITLIGSTTENPFINMTRAIVSRCRVFEFKNLSKNDIIKALTKCLTDEKNGFGKFKIDIDNDALEHIAWASNGDLRCAYNALELAVNSSPQLKDGSIKVDLETAEQSIQKGALSMDQTSSYDFLSAFCKSLRGSDTDAALFYSQRLLLSGYDPLILARRLVAHASEDIGMADSNALLIANCALNSCEKLGLPECVLTLSHAIIYICEAEKSNSVYLAMAKAQEDAEEYKDAPVPNHLKNHPVGYDDKSGSYKYPHNYGGYVKQQYLPTVIKDRIYYEPKSNGKEANLIRKKFSKNK